jgi:type II secretory ATPase GspE/PulE/Tfp pilus assembly ATPase PilB-like protein
MASSSDDRTESTLSSSVHQQILSHFQGDWVTRLNVEHILPIEICLYYQVLPLFLEGNRLNLGMVSPEDAPASEYVRRIISYLNYSLVPRPISSEALRAVLTAYLNYSGGKQSVETKRREAFSYGHYRHSARARGEQLANPDEQRTLVVDSPEDLNPVSDPAPLENGRATPVPPSPISAVLASATPHRLETPDGSLENSNGAKEPERVELREQSPAQPSISPSAPAFHSLTSSLPVLEIQSNHLSSPVEVLTTLAPKEMLQELLARVLLGGIGRLYFEVHPQHGRVLWSQNGVLQSVLDRLSLPVFQGVVNELKRMAHLSSLQLSKTEQLEIEYLHEQARVLLRFRFMPSHHGEAATLQVLRGAALKFYQQQQVTKLERDALGIARQLQTKLNEIRDRTHSDSGLPGAKSEVLPALGQLLQNIETQLDDLGVDPKASKD